MGAEVCFPWFSLNSSLEAYLKFLRFPLISDHTLLLSGLIDLLLGAFRGRLSTLGIAVFSLREDGRCFCRLHPIASQILIPFSWVCEFWPYLVGLWLHESSSMIFHSSESTKLKSPSWPWKNEPVAWFLQKQTNEPSQWFNALSSRVLYPTYTKRREVRGSPFFNKTPLLCAPRRWEEKPQAWMLTSGMQSREEPGNLGEAALQND